MASRVNPSERNRVITLGTDRVVLRVVRPPTTAELLDADCVARGDHTTEREWDPLAPRVMSKPIRSERRGRS